MSPVKVKITLRTVDSTDPKDPAFVVSKIEGSTRVALFERFFRPGDTILESQVHDLDRRYLITTIV